MAQIASRSSIRWPKRSKLWGGTVNPHKLQVRYTPTIDDGPIWGGRLVPTLVGAEEAPHTLRARLDGLRSTDGLPERMDL
jgi:hypothetical protein